MAVNGLFRLFELSLDEIAIFADFRPFFSHTPVNRLCLNKKTIDRFSCHPELDSGSRLLSFYNCTGFPALSPGSSTVSEPGMTNLTKLSKPSISVIMKQSLFGVSLRKKSSLPLFNDILIF
jgi:hypothetical protein